MQTQTISARPAAPPPAPAPSLKALWLSYLSAWRAFGRATDVADEKEFALPLGQDRGADPEVCRLRAKEAEAQKRFNGLCRQMHAARAETLEDLEIRLRHLQEAYLFAGNAGEAAVRSIIRDVVRMRRAAGAN
jgi:hypothetical protein